MARLPKVLLYFDRRKIASSKNSASVELLVVANGKRMYRSTGVKLLRHQWSERYHVVNHPDQEHLNTLLYGLVKRTKEWIDSLSIQGRPISVRSFSEFWKGDESEDFAKWLHSAIEKRIDIRPATRRKHVQMADVLNRFGLIKTFDDLTAENIHAFDEWLRKVKERDVTTIHSYHKRLKTYINIAIREQIWSGTNPYSFVKIPRGKSKPRAYLKESEIRELANHDFCNQCLNNVRDLYLFQCFTGLSYAELADFNYNDVMVDDNGQHIITGRRRKTDTDYMVVLLQPALDILHRHDNSLPIISNTKYNLYLKKICKALGWQKQLTTHTGRHTFAMTSLNRQIPIEVVAKILGHTDIKTTQIYAKILQNTVVNAFHKLDGII